MKHDRMGKSKWMLGYNIMDSRNTLSTMMAVQLATEICKHLAAIVNDALLRLLAIEGGRVPVHLSAQMGCAALSMIKPRLKQYHFHKLTLQSSIMPVVESPPWKKGRQQDAIMRSFS